MSRSPASRAPEVPAALDAATRTLLEGAARLEKHPLARLVSVVEQDHDAARERRAALFRHLAAHPNVHPRRARVIGITGTPGAGKSSLIGRVALEVLATDPAASVAVLAIDPTSPTSGGALLGDRVRTSFPVGERRIYFRSQATQGDLGGVGRRTFAVTRLLRHLFDLVFVETVGIGQSEIEISALADLTLLVLQPLGGDHVQFLKAGVMEVPDAFVINKCDEVTLARRSVHELRTALECARIGQGGGVPIFQTSAVTGAGVGELTAFLRQATALQTPDGQRHQEEHFLRRAIAERYGQFGLAALDGLMDRAVPAGTVPLYEELEAAALRAIAARVR